MNSDKTIINNKEQVEAEENKIMGILAYLIFFIPLIAAKDSPFAMYHANQGLTLFLTAVAINVIGSTIPVIGWMLIMPTGSLVVLILAIIGIVNAANGKKKPLPLIGGFTLIK